VTAVQAAVGAGGVGRTGEGPRFYAWFLFALSIGLLLSDYMSRQVLNAVFPLLKAEWGLTDAQLGSLSGVVALTVGVLTFPLSLLADRMGRVRSIVLMAFLWSFATMACGLSASYGQMMTARLFVGIGEAAYGSVGIAVLLAVFPATMRSTITGAFMAGGVFGSVLGVALGASIASALGWRSAFHCMAAIGVVLALVYLATVREDRVRPAASPGGARPLAFTRENIRLMARQLFTVPSVVCTYVGSGLQLFVTSAFIAWLPSFFNRAYQMPTAKAGAVAAGFLLVGGVGMILCGVVADRVGKNAAPRKLTAAAVYCLLASVSFVVGFHAAPGPLQMTLIGLGMFFVAGASGPAGAVVANCTTAAIHATALATLTLMNNLLGLAPGPFVAGLLADRSDLGTALQLVPLAGLAAAAAFWIGRRYYQRDLERVQAGAL
jgi:predicted MFS family arabinose efflux permease